MSTRLLRIVRLLTAACLMFGAFVPASRAQPDAFSVLTSTAWCHETASSASMSTTTLRFQPNGVMQIREEFEFGSGSNNTKRQSARWELNGGTLIIQEPNGGQSRLPISIAGGGRSLRLTLANRTYSPCR